MTQKGEIQIHFACTIILRPTLLVSKERAYELIAQATERLTKELAALTDKEPDAYFVCEPDVREVWAQSSDNECLLSYTN
jgi:hypothetical protein